MNHGKVLSLMDEIDSKLTELREELTAEPKKKKAPKPKGPISDFWMHDDVLEKVTHEAQEAWIKAYGDAHWISSEIFKCKAWCLSKGVRTVNWAQRINNWLSRAQSEKPKEQVIIDPAKWVG